MAEESQQDYLVKRKGMSASQVKSMLNNVTQMAKNAGLEYHLDQSVMVNSFKAHRLIQLANRRVWATRRKSDCSARLHRGLNVADTETLIGLGKEIGLDEESIKNAGE